MPTVRVERVPVQLFGLGLLGFDHLHIVFRMEDAQVAPQEHWFVIEGIREADASGLRLGVEGWHDGTTLSDANGGLTGGDLIARIGRSDSRGGREIADGAEATQLWARLAAHAADIEAQGFPYIALSLPASPLPTINSSSLVASLMYHVGIDVADALPSGLRFSPGVTTLLGTSRDDALETSRVFTTLVGGTGDDVLAGSDAVRIDKLYGGRGDDTLVWSPGENVLHGGQPDLAYAGDGIDTVDYTGAGIVRIEAAPGSVPHWRPDFIVTHASGQDYLFSIEAITWDAQTDQVLLGNGLGLVAHGNGTEGARGPRDVPSPDFFSRFEDGAPYEGPHGFGDLDMPPGG